MKKFILSIALPSALQGMITVAMSFIDTLMLGSLTESSIAAASLASQPVFVFTVVHFGLSGGSSVLTAQFWGSKDVESLKKTMGLMYRISAVISMGFFGVCQLAGARILGVMSSDPEVQALGLIYLHTVSWGFLFQGVTLCTMAVLRSVRTVRIAVVTSMGACVFNVVGNYLLIYGHGGFPALGVRGAAIATMAARVAECLIGVGYLLVFEKKIRFRISDLWKSSREIRKKFLENSALVIANESIWSLGMSLFMVIIGQLGTAAVTAYSVSQVLIQLAETFVSGIGYAAGVMSGNLIGAGKRQEAQRSAEQFIRISVLLGIGVGLIIWFGRFPYLAVYRISGETKQLAGQILKILAVQSFFQTIYFVNMMGTLRGGGDTRFVLCTDILFLWCVSLPFGYLFGIRLQAPVWLVVLALKSEGVFKSLIALARIKRKRWIHNLTVEPSNTEQ